MQKKRLLTGLQSSGRLHIGNYFGALVPFRSQYTEYDSFLMVVDYHSLTSVHDGNEMRQNTFSAIRDYVALGIDPDKCTMFKQSDVPEHMELTWIFNCLVTVPFLMTGHAYKDKVERVFRPQPDCLPTRCSWRRSILLYDTDVVPVGEDQRQHVEFAREARAKFHLVYGETFHEPKEQIRKEVAVIPGTDGQKMAKSRPQYTIPIFATRDEIAKQVMSIVTDSSGDTPVHVYALHKLYRPEAQLQALYEENKGKYKVLKETLIEDIDAVAAPLREKRAAITDEDVRTILKAGGEKARVIASAKMAVVRQKVGVAV